MTYFTSPEGDVVKELTAMEECKLTRWHGAPTRPRLRECQSCVTMKMSLAAVSLLGPSRLYFCRQYTVIRYSMIVYGAH
jgi:hypothetical protein